MSRKRFSYQMSSTRYEENVRSHNLQEEQFTYIAPGCYHVPQVPCEVTPFVSACFQNFKPPDAPPSHNTATYVVDAFGTAFYFSDLEHQITLPQNHTEANISYSLDKNEETEEDEYEYNLEVAIPRKRNCLEPDYYEQDQDDYVEPTKMKKIADMTKMERVACQTKMKRAAYPTKMKKRIAFQKVKKEMKISSGQMIFPYAALQVSDGAALCKVKDVAEEEQERTILEQENTNDKLILT